MASSSVLPAIDKLTGRDNFNMWKFAVQTYLEHEELWKAVLGTENDAAKITKARTKIILLIHPSNFVHVQKCATAAEVWKKLEDTFDDSGLTRRVGLLRTLITTRLENFDTVDQYVNQVMTTAHRLTAIQFEVSEEWIGTFLLAGLPDEYKPMIMGIESSGLKITGDVIKAKLLQDVKATSTDTNAFYSFKKRGSKRPGKHNNTAKGDKSGIRCYNCNLYGHLSAECRKSKKKTNQSVNNTKTQQSTQGSEGFCAGFSSGFVDKDGWFIDSGASFHMTMRDDWMEEKYHHDISEITVANDSKLNVASAGKVVMKVHRDGSNNLLPINDVLHVPKLSANLLSVSQIVSRGFEVIFDINGCRILDSERNMVATGRHINNMFKLNASESGSCFSARGGKGSQLELWHQRMGHLNVSDLAKLRNGMGIGVNFNEPTDNPTCVTCLEGKQTRKPFNTKGTRATEILELVHSDLCGPMETNSFGGARYFYTFIDDLTRMVFVYFLKTKDLAEEVFKNFKAYVENQSNKRIKTLRSDNGGEYISKSFENYLKNCGIHHQTSMPYTPQQNGVAERMNRTLQERGRCMMFNAGLTKDFWGEAVATAAYIINRSPTNALAGVTPFEAWTGKEPDLSHFRVFGCNAMVHVPKVKRKKWDVRSNQLIFTGYCETSKGYRFIHPTTKKLTKTRDVVFMEDSFIGNVSRNDFDKDNSVSDSQVVISFDESQVQVEATSANETTNESDNENSSDDPNFFNENSSFDPNSSNSSIASEDELNRTIVETVVVPRRTERVSKQRVFPDCVSYFVHGMEPDDPLTVDEAMNRYDSELWKKAMDEEFAAHKENKTWELCDLPPNRKPLGCKWVFKTKKDADGNIVRHKARLVIQGFLQRKGIDYEETFSPVIRYSSIRFILALAVKFNLELQQMDAVTAFIQGDVDEEIYMVQPKEFQQGNKVCKLNKAIYGLKQASRLWNLKLDAALQEIGFTRSKVDPCIYFKVKGKLMTVIGVYVDDSLIAFNDKETRRLLDAELHKRFKMKDLGEAKSCVGLRITRVREKGEIFIDQEKHILELLKKFNMVDCNPALTPSDPNQRLSKEMCPKNRCRG